MRKILIVITTILTAQNVLSQISITGSMCVRSGLPYQYVISGKLDSTTSLQVCVTGGFIGDSSHTCVTVNGFSTIHVLWNEDTVTGTVAVTSTAGNATLNVTISSPLQGGVIDSSVIAQAIGYDSLPKALLCSVASQGNCDPHYNYVWQQSDDNVQWTDMDNVSGQNLFFDIALTRPTYFRRKVIETGSGSVAYSNVAFVFVNPPRE